MTELNEIREAARHLITTPHLSYRQRLYQLALFAEELIPYPKLSSEAEEALAGGLVSDLDEGHAPYRPRYALPDYGVALVTVRLPRVGAGRGSRRCHHQPHDSLSQHPIHHLLPGLPR